MAQYNEMLGAVELKDIQLGNAVYNNYFYIPVFTYGEHDEYYEEHRKFRLKIEINDGHFSSKGYTSKVTRGETLWQTIKNDLQKDFKYTNWFMITSIEPFDSIDDKNDQPLDRFLVQVGLSNKINTNLVNRPGLRCHWNKIEIS